MPTVSEQRRAIEHLRSTLDAATPGPWEIQRENHGDGYITLCLGGLTIARVPEDTREDGEEMRALADARALLALRNAAAVLLEIVAAAVEMGHAFNEEGGDLMGLSGPFYVAEAKLQAAIARLGEGSTNVDETKGVEGAADS